jgi:RNA polymerase sigma-70 factor (ECF subfamily)
MRELAQLIPTRRSLLSRLKNWDDHESWRTFFDTYWKLIYNAAIRAGLTDAEAQDVVQETVINISKKIPEFVYDPAKGSFKTWLLRQTSWRISTQFRKRLPIRTSAPAGDKSSRTTTLERVPDPALPALDSMWDDEWERTLMEAALRRVKDKVNAKHYQIFDLAVHKGWPVSKVATDLKINAASVYLAKHRVANLLKKELQCLKSRPM